MSNTVIRVENLSKAYRLGVINHGMLYKDIQSWWARFRGKEDPNSVIGMYNKEQIDGDDRFWALRDINFQVKQGDRVGIIGKNGAGKSTLLKILSRVTAPTKGNVRVKGRIASLLEVGTGFHPELTGRENVFLNGAILGMSKQEIAKKFDEIVDFAGIGKFIDTPVKRYSSGMYVRLAFAVAAHLEPEILVVDEVLAVGDAEFQKKAIGKMEDVSSGGGRTILFVSHNMNAITRLCPQSILLNSGMILDEGDTSKVIINYYNNTNVSPSHVNFQNHHVGDKYVRLLAASVLSENDLVVNENIITESIKISMVFEVLFVDGLIYVPNFHFYTNDGYCAFVSANNQEVRYKKGIYKAECLIPGNFLNEGLYNVGIAVSSFNNGKKVHFYEPNILAFNIRDPFERVSAREQGYVGTIPGIVRPNFQWNIRELE